MRSIFTVIFFGAVIIFCAYWLRPENKDINNPTKIPVVGPALDSALKNYNKIPNFFAGGPVQGFWTLKTGDVGFNLNHFFSEIGRQATEDVDKAKTLYRQK